MSQTVSEYRRELERLASQDIKSDEDYERVANAGRMEEALHNLQAEALQLGYSGSLNDARVDDLLWFVEARKTTSAETHQVKAPQGDSARYNYPLNKRREIVEHYRKERAAGKVLNKDTWAQSNHMITGRTLLNYEREFPEREP